MAVISGQVTATIADAGPAVEPGAGGQARALAVRGAQTDGGTADVPTLKEAGADVDAVL